MESLIAIVSPEDSHSRLQVLSAPESNADLELTPKVLDRSYPRPRSETLCSTDSEISSEPSSSSSSPQIITSVLAPETDIDAPLPRGLLDLETSTVDQSTALKVSKPRLDIRIQQIALAAHKAYQRILKERLKLDGTVDLNPFAPAFIPWVSSPFTPPGEQPSNLRCHTFTPEALPIAPPFLELERGVREEDLKVAKGLANRLVKGHIWSDSLMHDLVTTICCLAFSVETSSVATFSALLREQFTQNQGHKMSQVFAVTLSRLAIEAFRGFWDTTNPRAIRSENPWSSTVISRATSFTSFVGDLYAQCLLSTDSALECVRLLSSFTSLEHVTALHLLVSHAGPTLWFAHPIEQHRQLPPRIGNQVIDAFVKDIEAKAHSMERKVIGFTHEPLDGELLRLTDAVVNMLLSWKLPS